MLRVLNGLLQPPQLTSEYKDAGRATLPNTDAGIQQTRAPPSPLYVPTSWDNYGGQGWFKHRLTIRQPLSRYIAVATLLSLSGLSLLICKLDVEIASPRLDNVCQGS